MVKIEFKSNEGLMFNIMFHKDPVRIVGFEYEDGIEVEKLRSLQAFNFSNEIEMKRTVNTMIPCKQV